MTESIEIELGETPRIAITSDVKSHEQVLAIVERLLKKYFIKNNAKDDKRDVT